tara:strand:- start:245 stop:568 length:324 start_codon:yes stop_codon:yes gene_type:complete
MGQTPDPELMPALAGEKTLRQGLPEECLCRQCKRLFARKVKVRTFDEETRSALDEDHQTWYFCTLSPGLDGLRQNASHTLSCELTVQQCTQFKRRKGRGRSHGGEVR